MSTRRSPQGAKPPSEPPEGNNDVVSKGPCPKCDTEFGNVTYADGHSFCFACEHHVERPRDGSALGRTGKLGRGAEMPSPGGQRVDGPGESALLSPQGTGDPFPHLTKRGLRPETLKRYGYFIAPYKGQPVHVAPYFDQQGELVCQKLRFPDKSFAVLKARPDVPAINECLLFGRQVYGDKYDKRVVITEGELDAMSVGQELGFGIPSLSINGGSKAAAKAIKANWLWLDRFEEIILWFDDDEPGLTAAQECAQLFAVGKVKLAKLEGCKDASDALQQGRAGEVKPAVFAATAWRPAGIVNAADNYKDVCAPTEDDEHAWAYNWPWKDVQDTLGPMLPGQVTYHVAGTGIGKTTGIAEIEYDLLKQGCKIAHMGFEDTRRDVKLRLLGIEANKRLDVALLPDEEMRKLHDKVFGSRQIEMFDPETAEWTVDAILGYVRYCAKALDCRVIFIDPLSFIAAGMSLSDDERRALDKASRDLAAMAKELGVHLQITHHLTDPRDGKGHNEGASSSLNQIRGSAGMGNFATFVIGHERNQQAEGDQFLLTQLRSLKNRPRSITGPMAVLRYSMETGRLTPTQEPFPGKGDSDGGKGGRSKSSGHQQHSNEY